MKFQDTREQLAIYDALLSGVDITVKAYAGTGKTATLEGGSSRMADQVGLYVAFNKDIQLEAQSRMPTNVISRTFNSLAYEVEQVGKRYGNQVSNFIKLPPPLLMRKLGLVKALRDVDPKDEDGSTGLSVVKRTLTRFMQSADEYVQTKHVPHEVERRFHDKTSLADYKTVIVKMTRQLWFWMIDPQESDISLLHDAYLKLWHLHGGKLPFEPDLVMIDEAQDMNAVNIALVQGWPGQVCVVGDENQGIYMFRGAINALQIFKTDVEKALTQVWRTGEGPIIDMANSLLALKKRSLLPLIGNPHKTSKLIYDGNPTGQHTVLCRTNMGLMSEALEAANRGDSICVVGKIQDALKMLESAWYLSQEEMKRVKHPDIKLLGDWETLEIAAKDDVDLKLVTNRIKEYGARIPKICKQLADACSADEEDADVIISTAHKSKGKEWDIVRLSGDFPEPFKFDEEAGTWKINEQELNLAYVATTRARDTLYGNAMLMTVNAMSHMTKAMQQPAMNDQQMTLAA